MKTQTLRFLLLTGLIFSWLTPSTTAHAASLVVNSLSDTTAVDGNCTLREAIQNANEDALTNADCPAGSGADTITFNLSLSGGTITLLSELSLDQDVTIDGSALAAQVTISGPGEPCTTCFRVFYVGEGVTATLNSLTIANGKDQYGGGGIRNEGTLTVTNSTLSGNSAGDSGVGGGIFNISGATLTITNSTLSGNSVGNSGGGGGIYNTSEATLTITNSTLAGNSAGNGSEMGGSGGGIYNGGTLIVTNSSLSGNSAGSDSEMGGSGGGILNGGTLTITNSSLSENSAGNNSEMGGAGGGISNGGTLTLANSTLSENSAGNNSVMSGYGGGIYNGGALRLTNSTLSGNSANSYGYGGGIYSGGDLNYANTIIANSTGNQDCYNAADTITTNTNNLVEDGSCPDGGVNFKTGDPHLAALANNGGPTQTHALLAGSPAIDAGDDATCSAAPVNGLDQRGVTRPQGAYCDIGSFELDNTPPTVLSSVCANPSPTNLASVDFTVTFSESVTGVAAGDFALTKTGTISGESVTGISGGPTIYTISVSTGTGNGTLRLDMPTSVTVTDLAGNPLAGLPYTGNEIYTITKVFTIFLPLILH